MQPKEFTIESKPEMQFRVTRVSPVDLLAITTQMDFEKFAQTKEMYTFALEHIQVKIGDKWNDVKMKGKDVYMPPELEDNIVALNELIIWFLNNVVMNAFPDSRE